MVFKSLTVWVPAKRSMRIYEKNVQYNDRTDKKLKGFLPHAQHLLPPTDRGEEEGLTAAQQRFPFCTFIIPHERMLSSGVICRKCAMTAWLVPQTVIV